MDITVLRRLMIFVAEFAASLALFLWNANVEDYDTLFGAENLWRVRSIFASRAQLFDLSPVTLWRDMLFQCFLRSRLYRQQQRSSFCGDCGSQNHISSEALLPRTLLNSLISYALYLPSNLDRYLPTTVLRRQRPCGYVKIDLNSALVDPRSTRSPFNVNITRKLEA